MLQVICTALVGRPCQFGGLIFCNNCASDAPWTCLVYGWICHVPETYILLELCLMELCLLYSDILVSFCYEWYFS
jgi:hypothetical protein